MKKLTCKENKRGPWTEHEDHKLIDYVAVHGEGCRSSMQEDAGLQRCRKSCRLRWKNYLKPDIKGGNFCPAEEDLIVKLHALLGNRWSLIAGRLPGRSDEEVMNHWNSHIKKKLISLGVDPDNHSVHQTLIPSSQQSNDNIDISSSSRNGENSDNSTKSLSSKKDSTSSIRDDDGLRDDFNLDQTIAFTSPPPSPSRSKVVTRKQDSVSNDGFKVKKRRIKYGSSSPYHAQDIGEEWSLIT